MFSHTMTYIDFAVNQSVSLKKLDPLITGSFLIIHLACI